jgi:3-methyladenine DNA glycosylase/8-oxoguanine DNA glycosylase
MGLMASLRTLQLDRPLDLVGTLRVLHRGPWDPTMRLSARTVERASNTPEGPAAIRVGIDGETVRAEAWGPGADRLLDGLPAFLGLDDDATGFEPRLHPLVADLARRRPGFRLGRTGSVFEALMPAVLEQRITGLEAFRAYRRLILAHGAAAPGPMGLWAPPSAAAISALASFAFPPLGIEPRRGALLRRMASDGTRLEAIAEPAREPGAGGSGSAELAARLRRYSGIGPWTAAEVTTRALGDPDAVSVADAHLSNLVGFALAREPRATDERMLELLAPWAGHRQRVIRLLESSGIAAPRYGPRIPPRDLRELARRA